MKKQKTQTIAGNGFLSSNSKYADPFRIKTGNSFFACLLVIFAALFAVFPASAAEPAAKTGESLFAWTAYWDYQNWQIETDSLADRLQGISVFAAYFDGEDNLIYPEATMLLMEDVIENAGAETQIYLTIVNDIIYDEELSSLKDIEILKRLFSKKAIMENHIEQIISLTKESGADGLEIDYEAIKKLKPLWKAFVTFVNKLSKRADEEGIPLRIILEPNALDQVTFPQGPEYVIMCYNQFGMHSSTPGAKASPEFIQEIIEKSRELPGKVTLAFATGGFDWSEDGTIKEVTETSALALLDKFGSAANRDKTSGAVVFNYVDETGTAHEVWYADGTTILTWIETARESGITDFALWRFGGNSETSLAEIRDGLQ